MTIGAGESVFLDTNVLVAATDESRPYHATARTLSGRGRALGMPGATSGQVVREYLVVATRPVSANGLGLSPLDALRNVAQLAGRLAFCDEGEATSVRLRALVQLRGLAGKAIHDANVVATMATAGIETLVTENPEDFASYPGIRTVGLAEIGEQIARATGEG